MVIAEKPSVANTIASVLGVTNRQSGYLEGNGWIVSWCYGHLAEYATPDYYDEKYIKWNFDDLPIIPQKWQMVIAKDKKDQFNVLRALLKRDDIEYVVNGCDAGREGELIFNNIYLLSGSKIPVKRLWVSSMEDSAIEYAFDHLRESSDYRNLRQAAVCRAKADWLVGMNGTRAYTTRYNHRLTVGRVQTPTLAMLVERQKKIDNFVKQPYWTVELSSKGLTVSSGQLDSQQDADRLVEICQGKDGVITEATWTKKKISPPKLYDLTTLQREANRYFGYTAQKTLNIAQELYENKLITYPRTDCQYITDDMQDTVQTLLKAIPSKIPCLSKIKIGKNIIRMVNNPKVTDHTALLPTLESLNQDISKQYQERQNIYYLIYQRLAQAVADECLYNDVHVTVNCEDHEFKAHGKNILIQGYRDIEAAFRASIKRSEPKEKDDKESESIVPSWAVTGAKMPAVEAKRADHETSPPKPYTEDTLLSAMETAGNKEFDKDTEKKGLGTPATRASIIEKLLSGKYPYAVRKGKQILPTEDGKNLIEVLPEILKSPSMTAEWENQLLRMEKGEISSASWMQQIYVLLDRILEDARNIPEEDRHRFYQPKEHETIGVCPVCGKPVYESKVNFYCSDMDCPFSLWKDAKYLSSMKKTITKTAAKALLKDGRVHMKGLYSKRTDKTFDADLVIKEIQNGRPVFALEFNNDNSYNNNDKNNDSNNSNENSNNNSNNSGNSQSININTNQQPVQSEVNTGQTAQKQSNFVYRKI